MKKPFYKKTWFIVLVALVVIGGVMNLFGIGDKPETPKVPEVPKVSTVKKVEKSKNTSTEETSKESKTVESSSNSDDKLPAIKEDQMDSFIDYLKNDLTEKGVDLSDATFYNRGTILYLGVPNDYKYYDKTKLQQFADKMYEQVHGAFNVWSGINGVDYSQYPGFYIKTADGESLASQKLSGGMKLNIK